jgi:hypothetical protein
VRIEFPDGSIVITDDKGDGPFFVFDAEPEDKSWSPPPAHREESLRDQDEVVLLLIDKVLRGGFTIAYHACEVPEALRDKVVSP